MYRLAVRFPPKVTRGVLEFVEMTAQSMTPVPLHRLHADTHNTQLVAHHGSAIFADVHITIDAKSGLISEENLIPSPLTPIGVTLGPLWSIW